MRYARIHQPLQSLLTMSSLPANCITDGETMKIHLKETDYKKILEHAKSNYPEEACGLIAGLIKNGEKFIEEVYLLENVDHSREHFTIAPQDQLKTIKDIRKKQLQPLGNWHSHPDTPSRQSDEDIRLAVDSSASYIILSLQDRQNPVINSFHT